MKVHVKVRNGAQPALTRMETFSYPQFPVNRSLVHVALITDIASPSVLRSRIINASTTKGEQGKLERESVNFAFIDARLVSLPIHNSHAVPTW